MPWLCPMQRVSSVPGRSKLFGKLNWLTVCDFSCIVYTHWHLCHVVEGLHSVFQQLLDVLWQQEPSKTISVWTGMRNLNIHSITRQCLIFPWEAEPKIIYIIYVYSLIYLSIGTSMSSSICLSSKYSAAFLEDYRLPKYLLSFHPWNAMSVSWFNLWFPICFPQQPPVTLNCETVVPPGVPSVASFSLLVSYPCPLLVDSVI